MNRRLDIRDGLEVALAQLSQAERQILRLRYVEGVSIEQAAAYTNQSIETVRKLEARAKARIRAQHPELAELML